MPVGALGLYADEEYLLVFPTLEPQWRTLTIVTGNLPTSAALLPFFFIGSSLSSFCQTENAIPSLGMIFAVLQKTGLEFTSCVGVSGFMEGKRTQQSMLIVFVKSHQPPIGLPTVQAKSTVEEKHIYLHIHL